MSETWPTDAEERWLARQAQAGELRINVGTSTPESRREQIRAAILERELADRRAGFRAGEPETFAELFERVYGVPL